MPCCLEDDTPHDKGLCLELWSILGDMVVLLAAALLCGGVVSRFGHSPLVGYLIAGMILGGPGSLGLVRSQHQIEAIAELGVALLLFSLGLEFSLERLQRLGMRPLLGGIIQVFSTLLIGAIIASWWGIAFAESLAFGAMISLSSTAIVLRMLMERSELEMPHGRNCLAVLLTQDMAVVPLALLMTILGGKGGAGAVALETGRLLLMASLLVAGLLALNRVAVYALGMLTLDRHRELVVILAVVTGLGSAWAAHYAGVSPALGAFVAGMLLGSSRFATQVRADISSLRVLLLTLFFSTAGMVLDPMWTLKHWLLVLVVTLALTVGKMVIIWAIFRWLGQSNRVSAATGLCLAQIGEFAFVLGTMGQANGVVSKDVYALVISTTILSFLLSAFLVPLAVRFGDRMALWIGKGPAESDTGGTLDFVPDVVLIGFGPAGQAAVRPLVDHAFRVVVIDLNHDSIRQAQILGFHGQIGDAMQFDVLEHARIEQCRAVIITVPHHHSALAILDNVRQQAPHAFVLVRSRYKLHSKEFASRGVVVVGDEEEVGVGLANQIETWAQTQTVLKDDRLHDDTASSRSAMNT